MELYEALKSGTSAEDLEASFRKELTKAQKRIAEEEEEEKKKKEGQKERAVALVNTRHVLALSLYDYSCALLGDDIVKDEGITVNEIENKLIESEESVMNFYNFSKRLEKSLGKLKSKVPTDAIDDDIINRFLRGL